MPSPVPLSEAELRRRRPVWIALSDLWLDTEIQEFTLRHIARVVAASGYSDGELARIHWNEVAPVVAGNLLALGGEWAGFDEDWLCGEAARFAARPPRLSLTRFLARRLLGSDWPRLLVLLPLARLELPEGGTSAG